MQTVLIKFGGRSSQSRFQIGAVVLPKLRWATAVKGRKWKILGYRQINCALYSVSIGNMNAAIELTTLFAAAHAAERIPADSINARLTFIARGVKFMDWNIREKGPRQLQV